METPYLFSKDDLATLILKRFYPERTDRESTVIRDWLIERGAEYDRFAFSVRIGAGMTPDPSHLPAVQSNTIYSSQKRIDILAWRGPAPTIVEVKYRVSPASLGQIQTYRHLFLEENPDAPEPDLVVIGRYSDADTVRVLNAQGVTVYLYESDETSGISAANGL